MQRFIDFFTALGQHPNRVNDFVAAASADPALAAKLAAAVDADDNRAALRLMADQQWSRAPVREAPAPAAPSGSRSPMSFEDRLLNDPNIRKSIEESGQAYPAGNAEAVMEAMRRGPVQKRGRPKAATAEDSIRELAKEPAPAPTIAEQFDSAVTGGSPRAAAGPATVDGIFGLGEMSPLQRKYIDAIKQGQYNDMAVADLRRPMGPDVAAMDDAIDGPAPGMARPAPARPAGKDAPGIPWSAIGAGIAVGLAGSELSKPSGGKPAKKESTTADLVEESRPAPKVAVEEPKPSVVQGPPDYSAQARSLIARANDIQRAEGRQTPESMELIQEADRLYQMAAEGRRAGTQPAIMPDAQQNAETSSIQRNAREQIAQNQDGGYRNQARRMMAELNMRSSQGNISQAEYAQMKAEIDRLFAMADQQDNAPRRASRPGMGRTQFPRARANPMQMIPNTRGLRPLAGPKTT